MALGPLRPGSWVSLMAGGAFLSAIARRATAECQDPPSPSPRRTSGSRDKPAPPASAIHTDAPLRPETDPLPIVRAARLPTSGESVIYEREQSEGAPGFWM